jgi:hypothetical protein
MRYAWIAEHGKSFALPERCEVLEVWEQWLSSLEAWKRGSIADRKRLVDAKLRAMIQVIHAETKGVY